MLKKANRIFIIGFTLLFILILANTISTFMECGLGACAG